ncbi:hypothetical protein ACQCT3_18065 [Sutcliffiella horikoshii]
MKNKRMSHFCLDKACNWKVTDHKIRDAIKCPKCDGFVMSEYVREMMKNG